MVIYDEWSYMTTYRSLFNTLFKISLKYYRQSHPRWPKGSVGKKNRTPVNKKSVEFYHRFTFSHS